MTALRPLISSCDLANTLWRSIKRVEPKAKLSLLLPDLQKRIDADNSLAAEVAERPTKEPMVRVWQNHECIVVPRHYRRKAGFSSAVSGSLLPIATRRSGGTAVLHGPDLVNISIAHNPSSMTIKAVYAPLVDLLRSVLNDLGLKIDFGHVAGSYCDGAYSIRLKGRKLGGTSAFVCRVNDSSIAVAHAVLHLRFTQAHLDTICAFERALGETPGYNLASHCCLLSGVKV